jgi:hypothetical protein
MTKTILLTIVLMTGFAAKADLTRVSCPKVTEGTYNCNEIANLSYAGQSQKLSEQVQIKMTYTYGLDLELDDINLDQSNYDSVGNKLMTGMECGVGSIGLHTINPERIYKGNYTLEGNTLSVAGQSKSNTGEVTYEEKVSFERKSDSSFVYSQDKNYYDDHSRHEQFTFECSK